MARRVSNAEVRRQVAALQAARFTPPPLRPDLAARADNFVPTSLDSDEWSAVRPLFLSVMSRSSVTGIESFAKRCGAVAGYLAWCLGSGIDLTAVQSMRFEPIEEYVRSAGKSATCRTHLHGAARDANPTGVPPKQVPYQHQAVKAPYSRTEMAAIERIAMTQPTDVLKRSLCAVVGLCRGAGLDSRDLRDLEVRHVADEGDRGIWIDVHGSRPRLVPVRLRYEQLVRAGVEGLAGDRLVLGEVRERRNVACRVVERSVALGDAPHIEAGRLRTTWLADLLESGVPLAVVMAVSGLSSARTLTDVLAYVTGPLDLEGAR